MSEIDIQRIIDMNYRCLTLLGYIRAVIKEMEDVMLKENVAYNFSQLNWWNNAVDNIIYFDKPLDPPKC